MLDQRYSDNEPSKRDIPSFIEPRPPLISNPFMRPRPQKGTNLLDLFDEDSENEEPELVQVYLRLKPYHARNNLYEVKSDRCLITSVDTATAGHGRRTQHNVSKMYTFSHIFGPQATQKELFEHVVKDNLKKLPEGQSFTLLTYGASGSGKTYTLMGTVASPGLVPRSLEYVFRLVDAAQTPEYKPADGGADKLNYAEQDYELQWVKRLRHVSAPLRDKYRRMSAGLCSDLTASSIDLSNRKRYYVWVSFIEIYNEGIYDLLATTDRSNASKLRIREDANGQVYVKGVTQAFVRSGEEAYDVMVAGKHNLQVATTGIHAHSSRSHCIFTITMLTEMEGGVRTSCVRLCDLAGCERAQRTRNTGARMVESRAINSSLHVLERCLHTLRRKQRTRLQPATCVPYRESKLTRLLGAGLSGTRGEPVSMVVTLNPAPEYAHETKHVLQLAAVARDIQVNNTIAESTLESSTQDTTVSSSAEVMRLRSDNERLHFELVQAQARNKELAAAMEEKQQEAANTMRELVEEAKDMTRQYYEAQIQSLRDEMEDMVEEYESRLSKAAAPPANSGTPSKALQNKIAQLMTDIAILEEKLTAERLARARAEEEVQHLRACIEERDEKAFEENAQENRDVMMLTDSEHDSEEEDDDDPCNESLEPTFKKEDINRSRLLIQNGLDQMSLHNDSNHSLDNSAGNNSEHTVENVEENESIVNKSEDTLKDDSMKDETTKESSVYATGEDGSGASNKTDMNDRTGDNSKHYSHLGEPADDNNIKKERQISVEDNDEPIEATSSKHIEVTNDISVAHKNNADSNVRGTYFVDNKVSSDHNIGPKFDANVKKSNSFLRGTYFVNDEDSKVIHDKSNKSKIFLDNIECDATTVKNEILLTETIKKKERVLETKQDDDKDKMKFTASKSKDSVTNSKLEVMITDTIKKKPKVSETLVSKIIKSIKSTHEPDSSLAQFEQLEKASSNIDESRNTLEFGNIKLLKEKRTYFDDQPTEREPEALIKVSANSNKHKPYFENIDVNVEITQTEQVDKVEVKLLDVTRSPSIVKDEITDDFKGSTLKKLLGESLTRQPDVISAIPKNILTHKKQDSIDIFEGMDSPLVINKPTESAGIVENARECIAKMVLEQKSATKNHVGQIKVKNEIKLERLSIPEEPMVSHESYAPNEIRDTVNRIESSKTQNAAKIIPQANTSETKESFNNKEVAEEETQKPRDTQSVSQTDSNKGNNTIEEFENIYKDITAPRETEFELLISQNSTNITTENKDETELEKETKYNLRHKSQAKAESVKFADKIEKIEMEEVLLESHAKCESKSKPTKRSLRLRRRKNQSDEEENEGNKLKDMINLQNEFSDVTMDVPAPVKLFKDIPSPEKTVEDENRPPILGIQSCPSKSVTRSRRKLFTPRAEPLEESLTQPGDSSERVYVPRPSYHRARARRKL